MQWQRPQHRLIEPLEPLPATAIELLERSLVQVLQQLGNRPIEFMQAEELLVPQPRHDPALDDLHRHLGLGVVLWLTRPRLRPALEEEDRSQRPSILRHIPPLVGKIDNFTSPDKLL